jgi:branched-chain amino acid transport system ATP-binding protein
MGILLRVSNLSVNYGDIRAVKNISFEVNKGEIVTLIGANGAGKTTTMNTIAGLIKPTSGEIIFLGENIVGVSPAQIVKRGITLAPEGRQIFPELTVLQNLEMGGYITSKHQVAAGVNQAFELFPHLRERASQYGGTLSGGEQQMLAVARALMSSPKLLMLDEPSLGLAPLIVQEIFKLIVRISEMGTTIILVEQNARMALSISDRGYVLETGNVVMSDTGERLLASDQVRKAYLGGL